MLVYNNNSFIEDPTSIRSVSEKLVEFSDYLIDT